MSKLLQIHLHKHSSIPLGAVSRIALATLALTIFTAWLSFACGQAADSETGLPAQSGFSESAFKADGKPESYAAAVADEAYANEEVMKVVEGEAMVEKQIEVDNDASASAEEADGQQVNISFQQQTRKIVRNADMHIETADPNAVQLAISNIATVRGGWLVSSQTSDGSMFNITIRVPADSLDQVLAEIEELADKLIYNSVTSADFTEEFIDLDARRNTLETTINELRELLIDEERFRDLSEILKVQQEITSLQTQLEQIDGRLRFISQSVAFSRITVKIQPSAQSMQVDGGGDARLGVGRPHQFTARFTPPAGFDDFRIEWSFGDGSPPQVVYAALRTQGDDSFLTVPVVHTYYDDQYSPYAVSVKIRATSDQSAAEGEDRLWAHVSPVPQIKVRPPDNMDVVQGDSVGFRATFNDHYAVSDLHYRWDFDDGSPLVEGEVAEGISAVEVEHEFENSSGPESYLVRFEIWGDSNAGEVREEGKTWVFVAPPPAMASSEFAPRETATSAVNALIVTVSYFAYGSASLHPFGW